MKHLGDQYEFPAANDVANYGGYLNVYFVWENHLLFVCPMALLVSPDTPFGVFFEEMIRPCYAAHPDAEHINRSNTGWTYEGKSWIPDYEKTVSENGLVHMSYLKFRTADLEGLENRRI